MSLKRRFASVLAALALLAVSPPLHAQQQSPFNPSPAALNAANGLLALPWPGFVDAKLKTAQTQLAAMNGKKFVNTSGNGYEFTLALDGLRLDTNVASLAPGFSPSAGGISILAPLNGTWSFAVSGNLIAHAKATATATVVSGVSGTATLVDQDVSVPFALGIDNVSFSAFSAFDTTDPARPKLTSAAIQAHARIGGSVLFPPHAIDFDLTRRPDGFLAGQASLTQVLGIPGFVDVDEGVNLSILVLPFSIDNTWTLVVALEGAFNVHFPQPLGTIKIPSAPFFTMPLVIPTPDVLRDSVGAYVAMARGTIPIPWPPANSVGPPLNAPQLPPSASIDFTTTRNIIEAGIVATHMPYNAVLSLDYPTLKPSRGPLLGLATQPFSYGIDADSTIWTGHYLAAESFRYAATQDPNALSRVQAAINGIQSDFSVTTDAVLENGQYVVVPSAANPPSVPIVTNAVNGPQGPQDQAGFIFARSTIPHTSEKGSTLPDWTDSVDARIKRGVCLYVKPSGGWTIVKGMAAGRAGKPSPPYPTYAAALKAQAGTGGVIQPVDSIAKPISYGSACGNRGDADNLLSRDQISGVFMGLAYAYVLVPAVQPQVRTIIDGALDYVLLNNWNLPLPPDGTVFTSFLGGFDAQLDLLRIGATVDPTHVPSGTTQSYQQLYARFAPASALCWVPDWFSVADPLNGYYKYNLAHAFFGPLLFLETDPTFRANYLVAYNIMRAATANHRNAYFNLVDILVKAATISSASLSNASLTLGQETTSDLADFVTRWNLVKATNGMPTNATPQSGADYLTSLWPDYIKIYTNFENHQDWTTTFPIPLQFRTGNGMEFVWQMPPSTAGIDPPGSSRTVNSPTLPSLGGGQKYSCSATPPTSNQIAFCSTQSSQESPGVDFLLPYWLGVYLNLWPAQ